MDVHSLDYMYKPVVSLPQHVKDQLKTKDAVAPLKSPWARPWLWDIANTDGAAVTDDDKEQRPQDWRWSNLFGLPQDDDEGKDDEKEPYVRMGDRAFAGGSHGEVWRARRRCPLDPAGRSGEDSEEEEEGSSDWLGCDPEQDLVMKRLKLEHGLDLLEAGLREVYFGELLSRESDAAPLFPGYVDHFFRDSHTTSSLRSGAGDRLELWIVFKDAGPSLRSYIYTAVTSGDFVMYQHSPFWRRLRMSVASDKGSVRGSSEVALAEKSAIIPLPSASSDCWNTPNQGHPKATPSYGRNQGSTKNETFAEGKVLMREILKQVLTSASYLHSKGIIHRDIKPSNIMCKTGNNPGLENEKEMHHDVKCVLGDFSSAWDEFTSGKMYREGPTAAEQTEEYAPPEVLFGLSWVPFSATLHPQKAG